MHICIIFVSICISLSGVGENLPFVCCLYFHSFLCLSVCKTITLTSQIWMMMIVLVSSKANVFYRGNQEKGLGDVVLAVSLQSDK